MPRRKQVVQKQKRRKVYQPGELDVRAVKPKGAFRIFTNYRLFAIIGAVVLIGGLGFSALFARSNSSSSTTHSVRGADAQKSTPESTGTETATGNAQATIKQYGAPPA